MRRFRKEITEFVLDPTDEPEEFQSHLWRYPVRIETAIEYLKITPEEYSVLFQNNILTTPRLSGRERRGTAGEIPLYQLYGFAEEIQNVRPRLSWSLYATDKKRNHNNSLCRRTIYGGSLPFNFIE